MKKIQINTEIIINDFPENIPDAFNISSEEMARSASFYILQKDNKTYPDVVCELLEDNRLDVICCMAALYMSNMIKIYGNEYKIKK